MVAPLSYPATLFVAQRVIPDSRSAAAERDPAFGEHCFAVMLYKPPRRSRWRPRTLSALPPMHVGKRLIWFPRLELAKVLTEVAEFNARQLDSMKPGRAPRNWAVAVAVVCGFDETARVIEGGAA